MSRRRSSLFLIAVTTVLFAATMHTTSAAPRGKTVTGNYNDSVGGNAKGHAERSGDPNLGINSPGAAGNDESARAAAAMDAAQRKVEREFESSVDWVQASSIFAKARTEMDQARAAVVIVLRERADYRAALSASEMAESALKDLRKLGNAPPDRVSSAATTALTARAAVNKMESEACAADPAFTTAKPKLTGAATALAELRRKERAAVLADTDWQAAKQKFDDAKVKSAAAQK